MKEKFCLTSVASFSQINSSLNNKSKTKQTFSFGKTPRFDHLKPVCQHSTYGGDFLQHKVQGTAIGYGTRSDFTKCLTVSPSSTQYNFRSQFEENKQKRRGSSMGIGRDKAVFNQYVDRQMLKVPGSTKYQFQKIDKFSAPSYTLRPRTKIPQRSMTLDPEKENPGPGTYNNPEVPRTSKFSHITYGTSRDKRFDHYDNKVPGAGHYKEEVKISGIGKYSNSKYKGGTQAKFAISKRKSYFDDVPGKQLYKPGPGNYKSPSEFGQYDGEIYGVELGRFKGK